MLVVYELQVAPDRGRVKNKGIDHDKGGRCGVRNHCHLTNRATLLPLSP